MSELFPCKVSWCTTAEHRWVSDDPGDRPVRRIVEHSRELLHLPGKIDLILLAEEVDDGAVGAARVVLAPLCGGVDLSVGDIETLAERLRWAAENVLRPGFLA